MKSRLTIVMIGLAFVLAGCAAEKKDAAPAAEQKTEAPAVQAQTPPAQTPPPEAKPAEAKPAEPKPAETKPAEPKSPPAKPAESQPTVRMVTLVPGYGFEVALDAPVSTETHPTGSAFTAKLTKPAILKTTGPVIPAGSAVRGEVTLSKRAGRVGGKAELTLEFRELTIADGQVLPLRAKALVLEGEGTGGGDVQKVVGGAVGGAIIGGLLGGKEGAVKGGAAGGAAGAAWAVATRGNDIVIDPGQALQVTLEREVQVKVTIPAGNALP